MACSSGDFQEMRVPEGISAQFQHTPLHCNPVSEDVLPIFFLYTKYNKEIHSQRTFLQRNGLKFFKKN